MALADQIITRLESRDAALSRQMQRERILATEAIRLMDTLASDARRAVEGVRRQRPDCTHIRFEQPNRSAFKVSNTAHPAIYVDCRLQGNAIEVVHERHEDIHAAPIKEPTWITITLDDRDNPVISYSQQSFHNAGEALLKILSPAFRL
jgi:hypothetical protein